MKTELTLSLETFNMKHRFILKKIVFGKNSWRKLSGLEIPVFPRLTAIAGHNGIGKSSILGFIANASGMSAKDLDGIKSYFGTDFFLSLKNSLNWPLQTSRQAVKITDIFY